MKKTVQESLAEVLNRVEKAKVHSGRSSDTVRLVAVTKGVGLDTIQQVVQAGVKDLGENRWQEFRDKFLSEHSIAVRTIQWHFIGRLQKNKVKHVVPSMCCIHSLDRWDLAGEVERRAVQEGKSPFPVFVQVNMTGNPAQGGVKENELFTFLEKLTALEGLKVCGFMTIAPLCQEEKKTRNIFSRLREVRDMARQRKLPGGVPGELSMGMSDDYEWAVQEGATIVRLGRALFGERRP